MDPLGHKQMQPKSDALGSEPPSSDLAPTGQISRGGPGHWGGTLQR